MNGIYPKAVWLPGPAWKQGYGDLTERTMKGALIHSMEGLWQSAIARLQSTAQASWHFSVTYDGIVLQHYPLSAVAWHGGFYANCRWAGIECEGRAGESLTTAQVESIIELLWWMALAERWPNFRYERETGNIHQHNWYAPTACPSGRIPFTYIIERLKAMADEANIQKVQLLFIGLILARDWVGMENLRKWLEAQG